MSCALLFPMQGGSSGTQNYAVSALTTSMNSAIEYGSLSQDGRNRIIVALADAGYATNVPDGALRDILIRLVNRGRITADAANRILAE